jgi:hypothetical protein
MYKSKLIRDLWAEIGRRDNVKLPPEMISTFCDDPATNKYCIKLKALAESHQLPEPAPQAK